ncbi:helix-turn-helix domain-containing protein [Raoultella terrigena]|uniref:helix-turn-helix domain-containing protein n=1 Tax=Raoultella terrigena TaxID=577 RepID=UPI001F52173D|nr:helix-turn-helix domain-containing protein [Raoultella terrigena]MCI1034743.1 helix-turn-helix domain-containing protein [Raoultella terrigena]
MNIPAQVIDAIDRWIDDNLDQSLCIDNIARHAGYSKWHLQRIFFYYKGESIGRYIRDKRLYRAAQDLIYTREKIMDISLKYGFKSQQTFNRLFTRTYSVSPGSYRRLKKQ